MLIGKSEVGELVGLGELAGQPVNRKRESANMVIMFRSFNILSSKVFPLGHPE